MVNHYNDGGEHIESSNIYDAVASFDTIANAQTDMILHYDEVVNFDSIDNAQIDMICYPDEIASFGSMPAYRTVCNRSRGGRKMLNRCCCDFSILDSFLVLLYVSRSFISLYNHYFSFL